MIFARLGLFGAKESPRQGGNQARAADVGTEFRQVVITIPKCNATGEPLTQVLSTGEAQTAIDDHLAHGDIGGHYIFRIGFERVANGQRVERNVIETKPARLTTRGLA